MSTVVVGPVQTCPRQPLHADLPLNEIADRVLRDQHVEHRTTHFGSLGTMPETPPRYAERWMPDVERLWATWLRSRDAAARDALVARYWSLVRSVAASVGRPRHLNLDELESHASLGLLDALDRYDPTKGPFEPYARARMRGAVIDGIREHDRASRTNLSRAKAIDTAVEQLTGRLHRPPSDAELAAQLGVTVDGLRPFHHAQLATTVGTLDPAVTTNGVNGDGGSGNHPAESNGNWVDDASSRADHQDVAAEVEHRLRQATLAAALDRIEGPDRAVLVLYYVAEMTMSEIARVLGVATARVSQIHSRAVRDLKAHLQPTLGSYILEESDERRRPARRSPAPT